MRIYVDGKKIGASPYNAKGLNDSKASLYIGVGDNAQWACTGLIDEIRIWEVARTEKEINDFMMNTLTGDEPGLNAHYTFDKKNADDNTAKRMIIRQIRTMVRKQLVHQSMLMLQKS